MSEQLSLQLSLSHHHIGDVDKLLPTALLILRNISEEKIIVNRRMLLIPESYPRQFGEIVFDIAGPPGTFSLTRFNVNSGQAEPTFFIELKPGDQVEKQYDLNNYFSYNEPGIYRIEAIYRNETDYENIKDKIWKGELRSNTDQFEIK